MNVSGYYPADMLNGPGTRVTVFVSGCEHRCRGCYNAMTWNPKNGKPYDVAFEQRVIDELNNPEIPKAGLSLSGGDPLYPNNVETILALVKRVREECPDKTIWLWTGYRIEDLSDAQKQVVDLIDVVIDGKFEEDLKDPTLVWRGSSNQRVIEVKQIS